jgi:V-type H+-transporting ATPase subunit a
MLFVKPLLLLLKNSGSSSHQEKVEIKKPLLEEKTELIEESKIQDIAPQTSSHSVAQGGHGHETFEFSEIFVHQVIETIEFVLGKKFFV